MLNDLKAIQKHCELENPPIFKKKLSGGDINEVFLIESSDNLWVVKKNEKIRYPNMLAKERRALLFFLENTSVFYAKPIHYFTEGKFQYLILEYVEKGENSVQAQRNLGKAVAEQHIVSSDKFGWTEDNYIGSLTQRNENMDSWSNFYANQRILPQTQLAFDNSIIDRSFIQKVDRYCARLEDIFPVEKPSLLHGDLWGGNYFIAKNEKPFLFDPAVYFGHREIDIAMTMLFGGFTEVFYESYNATYQLENGWKERIPHGQLYPNFVHLNLFGPAYLNALTDVINKF